MVFSGNQLEDPYGVQEQSKLSRKGRSKKYVQNDSDPDSVPDMPLLKNLASFRNRSSQDWLEVLREKTDMQSDTKIKSKTGGYDALVKYKIARPHKAILGGLIGLW